jgi:hypothetical protein
VSQATPHKETFEDGGEMAVFQKPVSWRHPMAPIISKSLTVAAFLVLASGCSTGLNLSLYHDAGIDDKTCQTELPVYVKEKKRPRVAVLPISDTSQFKGSLTLGPAAQDSLTQLIAASGGVEVLERSQLESFMQEMKFQGGMGAEIDPEQFVKIAKDIDTVFVGAISSATVASSFTKASTWTDKKGNTQTSPPSCAEEAKVTINIRALSSPSGTVQNSFHVKGRKHLSRKVASSSECKIQNPDGLLSEAVNKAIDDAKEDIANTFPSLGYIYKTQTDKSDPKQRIAYINLGKSDGLVPGNKVDIIEYVEEKDKIRGTTRIVPKVITEAIVSETQFLPDSSILVIPEETSECVLVGQAVRTKANVSVLRMINKALK